MPHDLRIAYFAHTVRSDWNNGNAHFLRGLLQSLVDAGQHVTIFEPAHEWSIDNLLQEANGPASLQQFHAVYPQLNIHTYTEPFVDSAAWREKLRNIDLVVLHEWNPPALAHLLLDLRRELGFRLLFHDTHHRASSSPEQIRLFGTDQFDGVLAFGEVLRTIYRERFGMECVWTFHEAADTRVFRPLAQTTKEQDVLWIGNWGEGERSEEIRNFLLHPAAALPQYRFRIHGVRYPQEGLTALHKAGVAYGGYLANLDAPAAYAASRLTVHVPRQQYSRIMTGIPTIRVFEALACGIPLISAPWQDTENLFRNEDFAWASDAAAMQHTMESLLTNPALAAEQAARGRETVLARHTCAHRAQQFLQIAEELFA